MDADAHTNAMVLSLTEDIKYMALLTDHHEKSSSLSATDNLVSDET
jgi:hypothetical protein